MAKPIDPEIVEVLRKHGFNSERDQEGREVIWNSHGVWVIRHWVLEVIAAAESIRFSKPDVLVAEPRSAVILVEGTLGGQVEWSIGEAVVDLNYQVKAKQPGYPFAIAEKRAKDRVILKLLRLHGKAYSEEEADEFKNTKEPWHGPLNKTALKEQMRKLAHDINRSSDVIELDCAIIAYKAALEQCGKEEVMEEWHRRAEESIANKRRELEKPQFEPAGPDEGDQISADKML